MPERQPPRETARAGRHVVAVELAQQVDPLEPQRREALLQRSTRPRSVKDVGFRIAVELAGEDETRGQAAALANGGADPLFAAAESIIARGVDEIGRPIENGV